MFLKKTLDLSIICKKYLVIFGKIVGLITNIEEYQKIYNHNCRKH